MATKQCSKCHSAKPLEAFATNRSKKGTPYKHSVCNECRAAHIRHLRTNGSPEDKARLRAAVDKYQQSPKFKRRAKNWKLKNAFGITVERFDQMVQQQAGLCAICQKPETAIKQGKLMSLAVDHNHETGQIRELLCARCNRMLGLAQDNTDVLTSALRYLIRHAATVQGESKIENP